MASLSELFKAGKYFQWLKYWIWKTKNHLGKMLIHYQERLKLFNYDVWRSNLIQQPLEKSESMAQPRFGFVIIDSSTNGSLTVSRNALSRLDYSNWAAWNMSGNGDQGDDEIGNGWTGEWHDLEPIRGLQEFVQSADLDYVCFIDSGDYFSKDYLSRIIMGLGQKNLDMIYCDEDHYLPPLGPLMQPLLKPDPSPALLISFNYLRHAFFHKSLLKRISTKPTNYESTREGLAFASLQPGRKSLHISG
ncbi:MAG: hypothetical protein MUO40_04990, partial [Anaerolineaceae bacterium]|nr:hypothetical protein [Anaerolineaceae bacterium]